MPKLIKILFKLTTKLREQFTYMLPKSVLYSSFYTLELVRSDVTMNREESINIILSEFPNCLG